MLTRIRKCSKLFSLVPICLMIASGCSQTMESPTQSTTSVTRRSLRATQVTREEFFVPSNTSVFNEAMADPDVQVALALLESEGSFWVDSASVMVIVENWGWSLTPGATRDRPLGEGPPATHEELLSADTIVFLPFMTSPPNMQHFLAIALVRTGAGEHGVGIVEGDISNNPPIAIREGKIVKHVFAPSDPTGAIAWWSCVASGLVTTGIVCGLSGPCYVKCGGIGALGTLGGCTTSWLLAD